ncbi:hypothetical protein OIU76_000993 [Salix suchowensis]|nr:hypothetical protein OIU76_000993 [Salix suchowensis]KAJ6387541.1 hypothetical protein OIU78_017291 [Salix suchowensis]
MRLECLGLLAIIDDMILKLVQEETQADSESDDDDNRFTILSSCQWVGMGSLYLTGCINFMVLCFESTIQEEDLEKREDEEMFEMNVALKLGRSLSQLRDLARKSSTSRVHGSTIVEPGMNGLERNFRPFTGLKETVQYGPNRMPVEQRST